jgi:hypothetical protein
MTVIAKSCSRSAKAAARAAESAAQVPAKPEPAIRIW